VFGLKLDGPEAVDDPDDPPALDLPTTGTIPSRGSPWANFR